MTTRVAVAGTGTIGGRVAEELRRGRVAGCLLDAVLDSSSTAETVAAALLSADVVVEASSNDAARQLLPHALDAGVDIVLCSCGVLAERELESALALRAGGASILVPSGAIGGLDILAAAFRGAAGTTVTVRHTTTKTPKALGADGVDCPTEVFRGTAREAALAYPQTSNSSVALARATAGLDGVDVVVIADPAASATRHTIEMESSVGRYAFTIENAVAPGSGGRTSEVTAWSVVDLLERHARSRGAAAPEPDRGRTTGDQA
ncbi:MAG: aspartate dehydrogenase [Frankiales bacterium]|nr:aspartate dehydrogenase [Frankiales bacterium]